MPEASEITKFLKSNNYSANAKLKALRAARHGSKRIPQRGLGGNVAERDVAAYVPQ